MMMCVNCGKHSHRRSWSRHQKGSSGASEWPLRAQISKKPQRPNLHTFKGIKFCTKCLRLAKEVYAQELALKASRLAKAAPKAEAVEATPAAA